MLSVKWNQRFIAVVENDITLFPNERKAQFKFCVHFFPRMRRNSIFHCVVLTVIMRMTTTGVDGHRRVDRVD